MKLLLTKVNVLVLVALLCAFSSLVVSNAHAASESEVMSSFNAEEKAKKDASDIEEQTKHEILFWMGIILLVLIIATAAVGINMAFFGKELFVHHMVLAGGTVFLSLAHAVTAIVWFYPF